MTSFSDKLDEVLTCFAHYCAIQGTPFGSMPNDADKLAEAKEQILKLVEELVIGEDVSQQQRHSSSFVSDYCGQHVNVCICDDLNKVKQQQRRKLRGES